MKHLIFLTLSFTLGGCGVTGTASKTTFPLLTNATTYNANVNAVSIFVDKETANNESYGSFNWGSFDDSDKRSIQQTILDTLDKNTSNVSQKAKVHAKVHRYSQVITNASYASFVIVDWCLEVNGEIIKDEVFYAGHSDELNIFTGKTLGWAKSVTHKAISTRIINQSIQVLSVPSLKEAYSEENVFLNAKDAVDALPAQLTSVGGAGVSGSAYYYVSPTTGNTNFNQKSVYKKIDWKQEIK
ncbi:hypothetical protein [Pseudoalteromonas sp. 1181_04]|uniref:hypothetical protein n=1 Tax=Pseudoalteromonas sp. 1181_04 TaxID=2604450 RepID=UPI00406377DC